MLLNQSAVKYWLFPSLLLLQGVCVCVCRCVGVCVCVAGYNDLSC